MSVQEVGGGAAPPIRTGPKTQAPTLTAPTAEAPPQANFAQVSELRQQAPRPSNGQAQPMLGKQAAAAQETRGEVLTDPAKILEYERNRPGIKEAYARLTPEQRTQFDALARSQVARGTQVNTAPQAGMGGMGGMMMAPLNSDCNGTAAQPGQPAQPTPAQQKIVEGTMARSGLYASLANGRLTQTDSRGKTTLENLTAMSGQKFAPGIDGKAMVGQTMMALGSPMMAGSSKGTAAAGALQNEMVNRHPADFVRQASELTSPAGETKIGQSTVKRDPTATGTLSDVYQASAKNVAREELIRSEMGRNPAAARAYAALPPDQKQKMDRLLNATVPEGGPTGEVPAFNTPEAEKFFHEAMLNGKLNGARQDVYALLGDGRMQSKDTRGATLLDNLETIRTQPLAAGLDRRETLADTLTQTARPGVIHQGNRGTCTVTTLEHMLAKSQPAEYARLVGGLTTPEGVVRTRNGWNLYRDGGLIQNDNSGRSPISRIFQGSMMEYANGAMTYDNARDAHSNPDGTLIRNRHGRTQSGLGYKEWERAVHATMGPARDVSAGPNAMRDIQANLRRGLDVPVGLIWGRDQDGDPTGHALSVTKMDEKYVYLRNPWGFAENGNSDPSRGPLRESLSTPGGSFGGGSGGPFGGFGGFGSPSPPGDPAKAGAQPGDVRMTREEFQKHLRHYYNFSQ